MMKIRPARLQTGDTVGLVSLSSPLNIETLGDKLALLDELGLQYKLGQTVQAYEGYLAGTDEERLTDFHQMIQDPEVKAIFLVKGEDNPKIVWGFSDVTALHIPVNEYSNIVTFHGPMLSSPNGELDELSKKMFQQLFVPMEIEYAEHISPLHTIVPGTVRGEVTGGHLNRIVSTRGTKFEIDMRKKVVLLEDFGESIEQIDAMMNQLRLARKLEHAAGFIIGDFNMPDATYTAQDALKVIESYLKPLNKPSLAGFKIGHCEPNIAIPLGVDVLLDATEKSLRILPGVK